MKIESAVISHVGKLRANNEDNYYLDGKFREDVSRTIQSQQIRKEKEKLIFAVCDGMGGELFGEIASLCAAKSLKLLEKREWSMQALGEYIKDAEKEMKKQAAEGESADMGAALAMLILEENAAYPANLGDSRCYMFRQGQLHKLSHDHTQAQLLVEHGLLGQEEARKHKGGHILTRYLGTDTGNVPEDFYQTEPFLLHEEDLFLLCSDGLTDMLSEEEIGAYLAKHAKERAEKLTEGLCTLALQAGGRDNITCMVVKIKRLGKNKRLHKMIEMFGIEM